MKRVLIITDISGLGNCSGSTDIAVLSAMGIECCIVPTAVLSAQTGFRESYINNMGGELEKMLESLNLLSPRIDCVLVGFLGDKKQTGCVLSYIKKFADTDTVIVTDPITGDNGRRFPFVSDVMFEDIKNIAACSTVITPNITEFCLLTDTDYNSVMSAEDTQKYAVLAEKCGVLFDMGVRDIIITGIELSSGDLGNLVVGRNGYTAVESKRYGGSYSGTGDLFTAIVCGYAALGMDVEHSAAKASDFISKVLSENADSIGDRNYGIPYQKYLRDLTE